MGIKIDDPLDDALLAAYAAAGPAIRAIDGFVTRISEALEDRDWAVIEDGDADNDYDADASDHEADDDEDYDDEVSYGFAADPPDGKRWWAANKADITISVVPVDPREEPRSAVPVLRFTLGFTDKAVAPTIDAEWLERLQAAGFDPLVVVSADYLPKFRHPQSRAPLLLQFGGPSVPCVIVLEHVVA